MSMLGFVYLVLILGWILIVLFLKCKKTLSSPFGFGENYTDAIAETTADRRQSVHVIQLQSEDIEEENRYMNNFHNNTDNLQRYSTRSTLEERSSIERNYATDAGINPGYTHDEDYVINAPPPTYEEVMRQPQVYPQVRKADDANL